MGVVPHRPHKRGPRKLCHHPALPSAEDSGDDDRVTAPACRRSSQSSQDVAGVTADGEALRLPWWIRASWSIRGAGWALRDKALLRRVRGQRRAWISAAVPPALLPVKICRLRFAGRAGRPWLPGRCHLVPVLASTLRHRPGQARRVNRGIRDTTVLAHDMPYTHVTLECSRGAHDPPQNPNQPRKCDGSGGWACCGAESEADGTSAPGEGVVPTLPAA
jgi:hypothetical protein